MRHRLCLNQALFALLIWVLPVLASAQLPPRHIWLRTCGAQLGNKMSQAMNNAVFERDLEGSGVSMREWMEQCSETEQCAEANGDIETELAANDALYWIRNYCSACIDRRTKRASWLASAYTLDAAIAHPPASLRAAQQRYCDATWTTLNIGSSPPNVPMGMCYDQESCQAQSRKSASRHDSWLKSSQRSAQEYRDSIQKLNHDLKQFWLRWLKTNKPSQKPHEEERIDPSMTH